MPIEATSETGKALGAPGVATAIDAPPRPGSVLVSAAIGAALTPLNSTMVAVALPALSFDFAAPASSVTVLVVTGYLVATLVFQMPAGNIADRVGYARALTWGRWIFGAGAVVGMLAPTLGAVVGGRLLMAAGGALILPTAFALLRITVPAERQPRAFGTMGAVLGGAAAIGPAIGAWMVAELGWRSLFVINLPLLVASWMLQPAVRDEAAVKPRQHPFDWQGSLLVGCGLVLVTFATRAAAPLAYGLAALGAVVLAVFIAHERRAPAPVLSIPLFFQRGFVLGAGIISTQNLAMYSLLIQVPFMFGSGTGADPRLGLAIIAMTATMALTSPVGGWLVEWLGVRVVVASGGLVATAGVMALGWLPTDASAVAVGACLLLAGLGLGLSTGPANVSAIAAAPRHQSAGASATVSMMRYVGSITGTVLLSFVLEGGAGTAARHHAALNVYIVALVASTICGLALPPLEGEGRRRRG